MKKMIVFAVLSLLIVSITSCEKEKSNPQAGTYEGIFLQPNDTTQTEGSLRFSSGVNKDLNLYLFGTIELNKESDTKYTSKSSALSDILKIVLGDGIPQFSDMNATFTFSGSTVNMDLQHGTTTVLTFSGTK